MKIKTIQEIQREKAVNYPTALKMQRGERLAVLRAFYLENLVEDSIDGTPFDGDILKTFDELIAKYT